MCEKRKMGREKELDTAQHWCFSYQNAITAMRVITKVWKTQLGHDCFFPEKETYKKFSNEKWKISDTNFEKDAWRLIPQGIFAPPFSLHLPPPLCLWERSPFKAKFFPFLGTPGYTLSSLQDSCLCHSFSAYSWSFMREEDLPDNILSEPRGPFLLIGYFWKSKGLQDIIE